MQDLQFPAFRVSQGLLDWLLQGDEPSVRYHTLVQLLGKDENSREAEDAERQIGRAGWAAKILGEQKESTYWDNPETCYVPKYASCIWKLIVLADLGVSGEDQRIKNSIEHFFGLHDVETGGFALRPKGSEKFDRDVTVVMLDFLRTHHPLHYHYDFLHALRVLTTFGIKGDPRMNDALKLLYEKRLSDGRWALEGVHRGWRYDHGWHGVSKLAGE